MKGVAVLAVMVLGAFLLAVPAQGAVPTTRLEGDTRIDTAVAISQEFWPDGSADVVLARSDEFPDALAGGPLADTLDAPILLIPPDDPAIVDPDVVAEIQRLAPSRIWLLGGPAAIDVFVESALTNAGYEVIRVGGDNRYETAALIDDVIDSPATDAVVASGQRFPDALMAIDLMPSRILLSHQTTFDYHQPGYSYTLVGGSAVLAPEIEDLTNGRRLAGDNRYGTAAEILDAAVADRGPGPLFVATGAAAPDALAAGGAVAQTGGYLLIVDPLQGPNDAQEAVLTDHAEHFPKMYVLGGEAALPPAVVSQVAEIL